jgi:leader peptidase (prepilin peptidase)/N-methyltransferase
MIHCISMAMEWLQIPAITYPIAAFMGLCFGSFISALSYRLPRSLPWATARSKCTQCDTVLKARDLIPLFSFLISRANCRYCSAPISWRYPMLELLTASCFVALLWLHGPSLHMVMLAGLTVCVIALILTDLEHFLIPDELQIAMAVLAVADIFYADKSWQEHVTAALVAGGLAWGLRVGFRWLRKKEGLGFGDVKLFAVAGLWLGLQPFVLFMMLAGVLGILFALIWRMSGRGEYFPFGPALAVALLICAAYPYELQFA